MNKNILKYDENYRSKFVRKLLKQVFKKVCRGGHINCHLKLVCLHEVRLLCVKGEREMRSLE